MSKLDDLEARLAAIEARIPAVTPHANPPITVGELVDVPAPGSPISSPWAQEVSNRIVHRFVNKAALDAWAAAAGSYGTTLDTGRLYERIGTAWVLVGAGRIGFGGLQPGQSWAVGQTFSMSWPQKQWDSDNFNAGGAPVTVPAGLDGLYLVSAYISATALIVGAATAVQIVAGGGIAGQAIIPVGVGAVTVTGLVLLTATQNAQIQIVNGHNAAMSYNGAIRVAMVSP